MSSIFPLLGRRLSGAGSVRWAAVRSVSGGGSVGHSTRRSVGLLVGRALRRSGGRTVGQGGGQAGEQAALPKANFFGRHIWIMAWNISRSRFEHNTARVVTPRCQGGEFTRSRKEVAINCAMPTPASHTLTACVLPLLPQKATGSSSLFEDPVQRRPNYVTGTRAAEFAAARARHVGKRFL